MPVQMRRFILTIALGALAPSVAAAQSWKEIGKTRANSVVLVDTKSIRRGGDTVTVTMRSKFAEPDGEKVTATRTIATFNCTTQKVAVKANYSYSGTRLVRKSVPKIPGYGVVLGGSLTGVAFDYLCPKK
jgi:hypothetical protein